MNPKGSKGLFPNNANWHVIVFVCYIAEICCPFFSLFLYFLFYWKHLFLILVWDDMLLNRKVLVENNANTSLVFFFLSQNFLMFSCALEDENFFSHPESLRASCTALSSTFLCLTCERRVCLQLILLASFLERLNSIPNGDFTSNSIPDFKVE